MIMGWTWGGGRGLGRGLGRRLGRGWTGRLLQTGPLVSLVTSRSTDSSLAHSHTDNNLNSSFAIFVDSSEAREKLGPGK